ncbi:MAG: cytidine deaminase [Bacteroidetes bacterium]|nr:cytidine deaminase [Bacteroidota bacterium]
MKTAEFVKLAREAQTRAFAPYSNFRVGAVLISKSGKTYLGCNVENSSYSLTCCAERVAIFKAISDGDHDFSDIYICGDAEEFTNPCGACRQVLLDLGGENLNVHLIHQNNTVKTLKCSDLLPYSFNASHLKKK